MTYDDFAASRVSLNLSGTELAGVYLALSRGEESLDPIQARALDGIRAILYGDLSIEDLEGLDALYERRLGRNPVY